MKFTVGAGGGFGDVAGRTQKTVKEVLKLIAEDCPRECHNCPACDEVKQECLTKLARHTLWKG